MSSRQVTSDLMMYSIDASWSNVAVGQPVAPETVIGKDLETGETLLAGVDGRVQGVHFSGGEHALIVLVQMDDTAAAGAEVAGAETAGAAGGAPGVAGVDPGLEEGAQCE
jgi:hypothetical protein